jgi:hypothetical protein
MTDLETILMTPMSKLLARRGTGSIWYGLGGAGSIWYGLETIKMTSMFKPLA